MNDDTRAWAKRYYERTKRMPGMVHAGIYSATTHYLNAVKAAGTDETVAVRAQMAKTPVNDMFAKDGRIREDGRMVHDMYRSEEHTSELQSLMRISYAVFCLKKKKIKILTINMMTSI